MNKTLAVIALTALSFTAQAQKGSWYIGGRVGFSSTTQKTDNHGVETDGAKVNSWSVSPEIGTFLSDHLQLGIGLSLYGSKTDARTAIKNVKTSTYTGATAYSRYFVGKGNFRPFVGINVSVMPGKEKSTLGSNATTETKLMTVGANLNAGFAYGLTPRVTVVGSLGTLGFESSSSEQSGVKVKNNSFGLDANSLGNRFTVGVYYTFLK